MTFETRKFYYEQYPPDNSLFSHHGYPQWVSGLSAIFLLCYRWWVTEDVSCQLDQESAGWQGKYHACLWLYPHRQMHKESQFYKKNTFIYYSGNCKDAVVQWLAHWTFALIFSQENRGSVVQGLVPLLCHVNSSDKTLYSRLTLFTQVYKWVLET